MRLKGSFSPPGDKSISHRLALMSLLAQGEVELTNMAPGEDVRSSLRAVDQLGSRVEFRRDRVLIKGAAGRVKPAAEIDCGNSGTTMRLIMGLLAGRPGTYVLDGDASLRNRPMERVAAPLRKMGAQVECRDGRAPVKISGADLAGISYDLPVASAQLKSAVLLAGLQAQGRTVVREPRPSRDHTEKLIALFGGRISISGPAITVEKSDLALPAELFVPGDPSSAAFFLTAAALVPGSRVTARGMLLNPTRIGFLEVLKRFGVNFQVATTSLAPEPWGEAVVEYSPRLTAAEITADEIPSLVDEVPILALAATQAQGLTIFHDVGELRVKETDRLAAIVDQLGRLGARAFINGDDLLVEGPTPLRVTADLDSLGDHRMAMTLRLAGLLAGARPPIKNEDCAAISYPGFNHDLEELLG
ncbi:MAG: 3-phosphoshikimate 1-carboxyvinyltransferase [Pseudomonadota bacterium]